MKDYTDDEFSKLSLEEKTRLFDLEAEKEYQKQIKLRDEIYPASASILLVTEREK
ncbi:hypothetical protein [Tenacibaculum sp. UWU-22]|uniref:hypothetical protein n=1 Tax=Tenacibaculum sp. UWU-22 TaxID=3234187 RepID=UPI0034DB1A30